MTSISGPLLIAKRIMPRLLFAMTDLGTSKELRELLYLRVPHSQLTLYIGEYMSRTILRD
jgi:hypothetical protein